MLEKIFENTDFGKVELKRNEEGEILFRATQVAEILGYGNPRDAVNTYCDTVVTYDVIENSGFGARKVKINYIKEPDLYALIFGASHQGKNEEIKKKAKKFRDWVFTEVLPSIRKHGVYVSQELLEAQKQEELAEAIECIRKEKDSEIQALKGKINGNKHLLGALESRLKQYELKEEYEKNLRAKLEFENNDTGITVSIYDKLFPKLKSKEEEKEELLRELGL
jgi:prophage antirepressor-like protein